MPLPAMNGGAAVGELDDHRRVDGRGGLHHAVHRVGARHVARREGERLGLRQGEDLLDLGAGDHAGCKVVADVTHGNSRHSVRCRSLSCGASSHCSGCNTIVALRPRRYDPEPPSAAIARPTSRCTSRRRRVATMQSATTSVRLWVAPRCGRSAGGRDPAPSPRRRGRSRGSVRTTPPGPTAARRHRGGDLDLQQRRARRQILAPRLARDVALQDHQVRFVHDDSVGFETRMRIRVGSLGGVGRITVVAGCHSTMRRAAIGDSTAALGAAAPSERGVRGGSPRSTPRRSRRRARRSRPRRRSPRRRRARPPGSDDQRERRARRAGAASSGTANGLPTVPRDVTAAELAGVRRT